jgi:hypothetical protein
VTEVTEVTEVRGFIVSAWEESRREAATRRLLATGRLDDGRSFALVLPARALLSQQDALLDALTWADLAGETLAPLELRKGSPEDAVRRLGAAGLVIRGLERARASDALLALGLTGPSRSAAYRSLANAPTWSSSTRSCRRQPPQLRWPGSPSTSSMS